MQRLKKTQRKMIALVYRESLSDMAPVLAGMRDSYPEYEWLVEHRPIAQQCRLLKEDHRQPWTSICLFPVTYRAIPDLAREGCLTPLGGALTAQERTAFAPQSLELASMKGQLYAIPEDISPYVLIARQDLLNKVGLRMPETWTELEQQLPILSKMCNGRPVRVVIPENSWDECIGFLSSLLGSHGVQLGPLAAGLESGSQAWKEVYDLAYRIDKRHGWLDTQAATLDDFIESNAAYCFAWPGRLARLPKEVLSQLSVRPVPLRSIGMRRMAFCKGTGWCVPRGTLAPDLAVELLKAMVDPIRTKSLELNHGCAFPAQHALWRDAEILRRKPIYSHAAQVIGSAQYVPLPTGIEWELAWTTFFEALKEDRNSDAWIEKVKGLCGSLARRDVKHRRIRDAIRHVDGNLSGIRRVEDVARHLNMHPRYFGVLFKKETGTSFPDWLTHRRMETAKEKLSDLSCTIKELAQSIGYRNSSLFCQAFKKHFKISATEMRRRLLADQAPSSASGKLRV
jgi:AraC-like DNA-binding protein